MENFVPFHYERDIIRFYTVQTEAGDFNDSI